MVGWMEKGIGKFQWRRHVNCDQNDNGGNRCQMSWATGAICRRTSSTTHYWMRVFAVQWTILMGNEFN